MLYFYIYIYFYPRTTKCKQKLTRRLLLLCCCCCCRCHIWTENFHHSSLERQNVSVCCYGDAQKLTSSCVCEYFNFSSVSSRFFFSRALIKTLVLWKARASLCPMLSRENSKTVIYLCSLCFILFRLVWLGLVLFSFAQTTTTIQVNREKNSSAIVVLFVYVRLSVCICGALFFFHIWC